MRYLLRTFIILIALIIVASSTVAQRRNYNNSFLSGFSVTPKVGFNWFFGDLVNERPVNIAFGITSEKELKEFLNARVDFKGGMMSGSQINPSNQLPFSTFENSYMSFEAGVAFHPIPLIYGYYKQRKFKPYVVGQIGIIAYNATETFGTGNVYTTYAGPSSLHLEGSPVLDGDIWHSTNGYQISTMLTLGGGLNYYINKKFSASIEFLMSMPFTDMLDAHKEWDANPGGTVSPSGLQVRTGGPTDIFWTGSIGVNYTFAESQFKNQFKYNRKSYLKTRKSMAYKKTKSARSFNRTNRKK